MSHDKDTAPERDQSASTPSSDAASAEQAAGGQAGMPAAAYPPDNEGAQEVSAEDVRHMEARKPDLPSGERGDLGDSGPGED